MVKYCKITHESCAQEMSNPIHLTIANPTEEQKAAVAALDGWLEMVYTDQPEHNPATHYCTDFWQEQDGKAVQRWEIRERPPQPDPEPSIEDRVDSLEQNVSDIINGVTGDES